MSEWRGKNLAGFIREPTTERALLDFMDTAERPLSIAEIASAVELPKTSISNPLARLVTKGLLERERVLMTYPMNTRPGQVRTIKTFLYRRAQSPPA